MANTSEFVNPSGTAEPELKRASPYLGFLNLVIQAFCVFAVVSTAFLRPTPLHIAVSAVLCLALVSVGYHNLRRTFFHVQMPVRWKEDDPKVSRLRNLHSLLILALAVICAGSLCFLFFGGLHNLRQQWQWFYPVVVLFNGCSDYIQDRLPLRLPRMRSGGAKIWNSMKPIKFDHWGERGAS